MQIAEDITLEPIVSGASSLGSDDKLAYDKTILKKQLDKTTLNKVIRLWTMKKTKNRHASVRLIGVVLTLLQIRFRGPASSLPAFSGRMRKCAKQESR